MICKTFLLGHRLRFLKYFLLAFGLFFFAEGPSRVSAQKALFELIHNDCPVLQDILHDMGAYYADIDRRKRRDDQIARSILDRLEKADPELIDRFFQCFGVMEVKNGGHEIIVRIPIAMLNAPTTPQQTEFVQFLVNAKLLVRKSESGLRIEGSFVPEY